VSLSQCLKRVHQLASTEDMPIMSTEQSNIDR